MKRRYKILLVSFVASITCILFFSAGSRYDNIKSSYFQLKLINSFERRGDWGTDGGRFKSFSKAIHLNNINNSKVGILSRCYSFLIEKNNPSYSDLLDKMNNEESDSKGDQNNDLRKKLQDGLGSGVNIEFSK